MNKQSLYLFGGALMASTALSSAHAATIKTNALDANVASTSALSAINIATEVFSATASTANALVIGSATSSGIILIDFAASLTAQFNVQLNITNAAFTGTPTVSLFGQSAAGSTSNGSLTAASVTSCLVQSLPDKILITGCTPQGSGVLSRADAMRISGITMISAAALATASNSIKLDGLVTGSGSVTFETITTATYVTSKSAADAVVGTTSGITIDNTATPVFSKFVTSGLTATLGSIKFSVTAATGADLSSTFGSAASVTSTAEVKVTHGALSDTALVSIAVGGVTRTPGTFVSGTVSFQVTAASLLNADIVVTFNGTTGITAASGTATATVTPITGPTGIARAVTAFSGNLGTYNRGGLNVEMNTLMPTAGVGSTLYRSFLRISNTSGIDGVATFTVNNDATGASIGSFTASITAGSTKQIGSADIETALTTAAATGAPYKVIVSGSFNGYVQHLIWNSVTGLFTDLSGFRNGALTVDP